MNAEVSICNEMLPRACEMVKSMRIGKGTYSYMKMAGYNSSMSPLGGPKPGASVLDVLVCQIKRHHLDEAGGRVVVLGVLREDDAALGVHQEEALGGQPREGLAVLRGRGIGGEDDEGQEARQDEARREH